MKPLKPNEVSYIIEAQIRGISVDQVLGKTPIAPAIEESQPVVAKKAPAKKRVAKPKEPKVTPDSNE